MSSHLDTELLLHFLKQQYGLSGELRHLYGDADINYRLFTPSNDSYIVKVSSQLDTQPLEFEGAMLQFLNQTEIEVSLPVPIPTLTGATYVLWNTENTSYLVRVLSWLDGRLYKDVNPKTPTLRGQLGQAAGALTKALTTFKHDYAQRSFPWNLAESAWTEDHTNRFDGEQKQWVSCFQKRFSDTAASYAKLPKSIVHNDVNDYNILVTEHQLHPTIAGIIDFGDAVYTQTINDLAILLAYTLMDLPDPLIGATDLITGYHQQYPLSESELEHLHTLVGMRLVTTVTQASLRKEKEPDNTYISISEAPAWALLEKWYAIAPELALYYFREACGYSAHPQEAAFATWAASHTFRFSELFPTVGRESIQLLDLKVSSTWMGGKFQFNDLPWFEFQIEQLQREVPDKLIAGGYCEPRPIYTSTAYDKEGNSGPASRTVHLGVDFWSPAGTPVHALLAGEIYTAINDAGYKEYGGLIIIKHQEDGLEFFTLHGHLDPDSIAHWQPGDSIDKGALIGQLGAPEVNGAWSPHLHFQLMLSMLNYTVDFPGVAYPDELEVWKSLCPDPNLLFKNPDLRTQYDPSQEELLNFRGQHLGKSLSVSYQTPLHIVRGDGVYLLDTYGRKYLDTVNNVAHVGHENPGVVKASQSQTAVLNTNTRYLNSAINDYADALLAHLPKELSVLHIVNSGSEANELAIRMAKTYTGYTDFVAMEIGYHGNTNSVIDVSSYKFDSKGGSGKPTHTHILPMPDTFRGLHTGDDAAEDYAAYLSPILDSIEQKDAGVAGFIHESILSCGGQITPPAGYFQKIYEQIRRAGGLCIADEVQTGFGRAGSHFWAFQLHGITPDIVTFGKPAGNGHPLAGVACTRAVADSFANGMEFFNTFGGNPVSCRIGKAVLDEIDRQHLQQQARDVGSFLLSQLKALQHLFPIIGDVRGSGFFLGIEFTTADKKPLPEKADYVINRMKEFGILMSSDGPDHNVLKIKPPMVFDMENAKELIFRLTQVLHEDYMKLSVL